MTTLAPILLVLSMFAGVAACSRVARAGNQAAPDDLSCRRDVRGAAGSCGLAVSAAPSSAVLGEGPEEAGEEADIAWLARPVECGRHAVWNSDLKRQARSESRLTGRV